MGLSPKVRRQLIVQESRPLTSYRFGAYQVVSLHEHQRNPTTVAGSLSSNGGGKKCLRVFFAEDLNLIRGGIKAARGPSVIGESYYRLIATPLNTGEVPF